MTDFAPLDTFRDAAGLPDDARTTRVREEFRARIATMAADDEGRRPFDPPRTPQPSHGPSRRAALALVAVAALLLIAGTSAFLGRPGGRASTGLDELALQAGARADQPLGTSDFLYLVDATTDRGSSTTREQWTAPNGTGQARTTSLPLTPEGHDPTAMTLYPTPGSLDFAGMTYQDLRDLPTEPEPLLDRLRQLGVASSSRPGAQAEALAGVAALRVTPPAVGAAAIRALEQLGGRDIGPVPDTHGRVGVGIRGDNGDGTAWLVVIDAGSGAALAVHDRMDRGASAGSTSGRVWMDQSITTSLPTE
jgi:hypothetical protein